VKMLMLKKQGIKGNILGKGDKPQKALVIEQSLRVITLAGAAIQFASVLFPTIIWHFEPYMPLQIAGTALGLIGIAFFILSVTVMRGNWRAGFNKSQNTELVTGSIYKISRNPAFVGFDLLYIGCAMVFPNFINIAVAILAVAGFHIQILGEEKFLAEEFEQPYLDYKSGVRRYL